MSESARKNGERVARKEGAFRLNSRSGGNKNKFAAPLSVEVTDFSYLRYGVSSLPSDEVLLQGGGFTVDAFKVIESPQSRLYILATGVGGGSRSEIVANLIISTIESLLKGRKQVGIDDLKVAIYKAHTKILDLAKPDTHFHGMFGHLASFLINSKGAWICKVGEIGLFSQIKNSCSFVNESQGKALGQNENLEVDELIECTSIDLDFTAVLLASSGVLRVVKKEALNEGVNELQNEFLKSNVEGNGAAPLHPQALFNELCSNLVEKSKVSGSKEATTAMVVADVRHFTRGLSKTLPAEEPSMEELIKQILGEDGFLFDEGSIQEESTLPVVTNSEIVPISEKSLSSVEERRARRERKRAKKGKRKGVDKKEAVTESKGPDSLDNFDEESFLKFLEEISKEGNEEVKDALQDDSSSSSVISNKLVEKESTEETLSEKDEELFKHLMDLLEKEDPDENIEEEEKVTKIENSPQGTKLLPSPEENVVKTLPQEDKPQSSVNNVSYKEEVLSEKPTRKRLLSELAALRTNSFPRPTLSRLGLVLGIGFLVGSLIGVIGEAGSWFGNKEVQVTALPPESIEEAPELIQKGGNEELKVVPITESPKTKVEVERYVSEERKDGTKSKRMLVVARELARDKPSDNLDIRTISQIGEELKESSIIVTESKGGVKKLDDSLLEQVGSIQNPAARSVLVEVVAALKEESTDTDARLEALQREQQRTNRLLKFMVDKLKEEKSKVAGEKAGEK
jgi:serine/threonine protein phosphatase PrpC